MRNVSEIPIEIDLLSDSIEGKNHLRKKYTQIVERIKIAQQDRKEMENIFNNLTPEYHNYKIINETLKNQKEANNLLVKN